MPPTWDERVNIVLELYRSRLAAQSTKLNFVYDAGLIRDAVAIFRERKLQYDKAIKTLHNILQDNTDLIQHTHSVRIRVKEPDHLAEKLCRKFLGINCSQRTVTKDNLFLGEDGGLTDLGGLRILLLYRTQWRMIHDFVSDGWKDHTGRPHVQVVKRIAYVRQKDEESFKPFFTKVEVKNNYTSFHYEMLYIGPDTVNNLYLECQVRTVFEDGWGEIDHQLRYPFDASQMVESQLEILAQSAQIANDIATQLRVLDKLPTFIPWVREQEYEQTARHIYCLTPNLQWAIDHKKSLFDLLRTSEVQYHFLLVPFDATMAKDASARRAVLEEEAAQLGLHDRLRFPSVRSVDVPLPVVSDILLLEHVCDRDGTRFDLAILAAPYSKDLPEAEQMDVVIRQPTEVGRIRSLLKYLCPALPL